MKTQFKRFFSVDSTKAIKANEYGYLNAINYMAPYTLGGVGNLCPHASPACAAACLGWHSGQSSMVSAATQWTNGVRESRKRKAEFFMRDRKAFMAEMLFHIAANVRTAKRLGLELCVRPNGSSDIAFEGIRIEVSETFATELSKVSGLEITAGTHTIFSAFPSVQYVDYTKNPHRFNRELPSNYHLTFSRSETNEANAIDLVTRGKNVAIVFQTKPSMWHGAQVIDGDKHDLRHLDPKGVVVGLSPKGNKAKRDTTGFVVHA